MFPHIAYIADRMEFLTKTQPNDQFDQNEYIESTLNLKNPSLIFFPNFNNAAVTVDNFRPLIMKFIKNLFLDGTPFTWTFVIIETLLSISIPISSLLYLLVSIRFYNKAKQNRGMSKYSLYNALFIDIGVTFMSYMCFNQYEDVINAIFSIYFVIWKMRTMGNLVTQVEFPYLKHEEYGWYKAYK